MATIQELQTKYPGLDISKQNDLISQFGSKPLDQIQTRDLAMGGFLKTPTNITPTNQVTPPAQPTTQVSQSGDQFTDTRGKIRAGEIPPSPRELTTLKTKEEYIQGKGKTVSSAPVGGWNTINGQSPDRPELLTYNPNYDPTKDAYGKPLAGALSPAQSTTEQPKTGAKPEGQVYTPTVSPEEVQKRNQQITQNLSDYISKTGSTPEQAMQWGLQGKVAGTPEYNAVMDWFHTQQVSKGQPLVNKVTQMTPDEIMANLNNGTLTARDLIESNAVGIPEVKNALDRYQASAKFQGMTSDELFSAIKEGDIIPSQANSTWTALYQGGQPTQNQIDAYQKWDTYQKTTDANAIAEDTNKIYTTVTTGEKKSIVKMASDKFDQLTKDLTNLDLSNINESTVTKLGIMGYNALNNESILNFTNKLYNDLNVPTIQNNIANLNKKLSDIQNVEDNAVNDIRKETAGEASESYILALAAQRSKDIYPQKQALMNEINLYSAQLKNAQDYIKEQQDGFSTDLEKKTNNFDNMLKILDTYATKESPSAELETMFKDYQGVIEDPLVWQKRYSNLIKEGNSPFMAAQQVKSELQKISDARGELGFAKTKTDFQNSMQLLSSLNNPENVNRLMKENGWSKEQIDTYKKSLMDKITGAGASTDFKMALKEIDTKLAQAKMEQSFQNQLALADVKAQLQLENFRAKNINKPLPSTAPQLPFISNNQQMLTGFDELENLYNKLALKGQTGGLTGNITEALAKITDDTDAQNFVSLIKQLQANASKSFGNTGTLSDQDIASVLEGIGSLSSGKQAFANNMNSIRKKLYTGIKLKTDELRKANYDVSAFETDYANAEAKIQELSNKTSSAPPATKDTTSDSIFPPL